ncbi:MAG: Rieske 2Fe-2S domain-containing protein [Pirellulaceae bacterium]|nr:Rieske 2Fe-2S domain-containing protein [Pirellulaceae bacterium]
MSEFTRVAATTDLPDPGRLLVEVEERLVVLLKVGGEFFCLDDVCTHDGGPLSDGPLDDHTLACPRHGAKFDIKTGNALTMPATENTLAHEVQIRGDEVWIKLTDPDAPRSVAPAAAPRTAAPLPVVSPRTGVEVAPIAPTSEAPATTTPIAMAGQLSEDLVREELKKVIDPELFINIVDLGLIYNVDLLPQPAGKTNCKIEMTMTSPMCPAGPQMISNSKQVLGQIEGMGEVEVKIVLDPPWTPDKMTQEARDQLGIF